MSVLGLIVACIFFVAGLVGSILPILPGAPLVWLGMLIYGFFVDFQGLSTAFYIWQGLAVALVFAIDYVAGAWGVRRYGGSRNAIIGSLIGAMLGLFMFGPAGIIFGPFVGAVAGELISGKDFDRALRAGIGTLLGFISGTVLKVIVKVLMIAWFFLTVL
ncbi:MAG: DUF456 family protein [Bacillota bacterium]|jgi:uncharacterized protein YqgC (DUF456 family)